MKNCTDCIYYATIDHPIVKYKDTDFEKEIGFVSEGFCKKLFLTCEKARDLINGPCGESAEFFEEV